MRRPQLSIHTKLFAIMCALTWVTVGAPTAFFTSRHMAAAEDALGDKSASYARLASRQLEPALAFDDRQTAREIFTALSEDPDVRAAALTFADGRPLHADGELTATPPRSAPATGVRIERLGRVVRATTRVVSREGPAGVLVLELGDDRVRAEQALVVRVAASFALAVMAVGFAAAWYLGRRIARRLQRVAAATRAVAGGDLAGPPLVDRERDEIGQLATSFNDMVVGIKALTSRIEADAREEQGRLDGLVRRRTAELRARNDEMRLVLDNVGQGLCTVDAEGRMAGERSAALARMFGSSPQDDSLPAWIARACPAAAGWLEEGLRELYADILPREAALAQMPRRLTVGGAELELGYVPIEASGALTRVLVVVSDVTDRVAREKADAAQAELLRVFERVSGDRAGYLDLTSEAEALLALLAGSEGSPSDMRRWLHTLKGNCASFGMTRVVAECHALEERIGETGAAPGAADREPLVREWTRATEAIRPFLAGEGDSIAVAWRDLDAAIALVQAGASQRAIVGRLRGWALEPCARRLARLGDGARDLATRLGKEAVTVTVDDGGVRVDARQWRLLWASLVHVIRNAIDHGIEPAEERVASGKPAAGALALRASRAAGEVVVEIADDGRGVDWGALRSKAVAAGMPACDSRPEHLLFAEGLSTREQVTEISGRGVGMAAVRAACADLGGRVDVESVPGRGTTIRLRVPVLEADDEGPASRPSLEPSWPPTRRLDPQPGARRAS